MTYAHLFTVLKTSKFSPEQMAKRLGISGMTLRRWRRLPAHQELPALYAKAFVDVVYALIAEGRLPIGSPVAQGVMRQGSWAPFDQAAAHLGVAKELLVKGGRFDAGRVVESLSQIGANDIHKEEVDRHKRMILAFKKMGAEWSLRISRLWTVLQSSELHSFDKLVAYGALFYLLTPFDLIPDYIPVFGFLDDFAILGLAMAYYLKRFPQLFEKTT